VRKRFVFFVKFIIIVAIIKGCNLFLGEEDWLSYPVMIIGPIIGLTLYDVFNYLVHSFKNNKKLDD